MRKITLQIADFDRVARNQIDSDLLDWQEQLDQPFTLREIHLTLMEAILNDIRR